MSQPEGILPSQWIRSAITDGIITADIPIERAQVQPNSIDLRLGDIGHRVACSFLPGREGLRHKLSRFRWYDLDLGAEGTVLERHQVYLFPLRERLQLPDGILARANPKSTTGRLDVFTRLVAETSDAFDDVPPGYKGQLYLEVVPRSFAIHVRPGDCLAQLRFQRGRAELSNQETRDLLDNQDIVFDPQQQPMRSSSLRVGSGVFLSVQLSGRDETIAFRALRNTKKPVDLRAIGGAAIRQYWQRVYARAADPVILDPDEFYIFSSRELVSLPPNVCAEMVPYEAGSGEMRTHYAGFFDSGFGYSPTGPVGFAAAAVVLEIRNRDVPYLIEQGQQLFRLMFLRNAEPPDMLYGGAMGSNYQSQRLRLSKQFMVADEAESLRQPRLQFGDSSGVEEKLL